MKWLYDSLDLYYRECPEWLNRFPIKPLRRIIKLAYLPLFALRYPWVLKKDMLLLNYIEMPLTTRCTLRCAKCANLIQFYEHPWDIPLEIVLQDIDVMLNTADYIYEFGLIGGETLLYPQLTQIIKRLCRSRKVRKISLTTNGTLLPEDEGLLYALAHRKVFVKISNYGTHSRQLKELTDLFDEGQIKYKVLDLTGAWYDFGGLHIRNRNKEELKQQFKNCASACRSYLHGRLHYCPRSSHGTDLGFVPYNPCDCADLTNTSKERKKRRQELQKMNNIDYITACNYCDKGTSLHLQIPAAVQLTAEGGKNNA